MVVTLFESTQTVMAQGFRHNALRLRLLQDAQKVTLYFFPQILTILPDYSLEFKRLQFMLRNDYQYISGIILQTGWHQCKARWLSRGQFYAVCSRVSKATAQSYLLASEGGRAKIEMEVPGS